jgi:RNA polymerase sigma factor (TIGR02999 family)
VAEVGSDVTGLLLRWNAGDAQALEHLTAAVYDELRRVARGALARERPGHTLSSTALVHEAYLRLVDQRRVGFENRAHFFGAAAHIMRRVLVDHARAASAAKRGGGGVKVALEDDAASIPGLSDEVLTLDAALTKLGDVDDRKLRIVEMKFFGGMTNQEVGLALGISDATVKRDWQLARAWLINVTAGR